MHPLCHTSTDSLLLATNSQSFQRPSADYSQPHTVNFGNVLRRLAFALASTFLYVAKLYSHSYTVTSTPQEILSFPFMSADTNTKPEFGNLVRSF